MKSRKNIELPAEDVQKLIKDLGLIVVSMDQIGSAYYDNQMQQAIEMDKFFSQVKAFKKLAHARSILSKAFKSQSTDMDILRLEESAESLPYWRRNK